MPNIQDSRQFSYSKSAVSPSSTSMPPMMRPFSTSSSLSGGMNGVHSPHSNQMPASSPPQFGQAATQAQQLPPACGARQLSKLKRFLTTLQQFGMDISPEIGEHVRSLVLALVNSHFSVEEFHAKLQQATNFPLRPFVIPFLKANLPLLQRELLHCAQLARQSPHLYLLHNERMLFESAPHSPPQDLSDVAEKRKSPDRLKDKALADSTEPAKRPRIHSLDENNPPNAAQPSAFGDYHLTSGSDPCRYEDVTLMKDLQEINRIDRDVIEQELDDNKTKQHNTNVLAMNQFFGQVDKMAEELKQVDNFHPNAMDSKGHAIFSHLLQIENAFLRMLGCVVEMVDKCKSAMNELREQFLPFANGGAERMSMLWMNSRQSESHLQHLLADEDLLSDAVNRQTGELVNESKRRAALSSLLKDEPDTKLGHHQLLLKDRSKIKLALNEARKQALDEIMISDHLQQESPETCWNCGRKASETCSGCNIARYCGSFCQHKDWEHHHKVCNKNVTPTRGRSKDPAGPCISPPTPCELNKTPETSESRDVPTKEPVIEPNESIIVAASDLTK